jgi:hypothetical protein
MSFFGKARKGAGAIRGGMGRGFRATGFGNTDAYRGMRTSLKQRADFSLSYGSIILITMLAASYLVVASLGIDTFTNKCKELAGVKSQENLNKWLVATLAIAITIPFTLIVVRTAGKRLQPLMAILFGILGIVASSAVIHWNRKCETPESEKIYGGINMAVFIVMFILGATFMMGEKAAVEPIYSSNGGVM